MSDDMIPFFAILMPVFLIFVIFTAKHRARKREIAHMERMKAMELGLNMQPTILGPWPALIAFGLGTITPIGAFLFAWLASMTTHASEEVWIPAFLVGVAGVIGGTRMGFRILTLPAASGLQQDPRNFFETRSPVRNGQAKPPFNPDAYDAIAHRG